MKSVATFLRLPARQQRLLIEALATLIAVQFGLRLCPIERLRRWAGGKPAAVTSSPDHVVWAVDAAARHLPGCTCLVSALALQRLLSRRGHLSQLHVGVSRRGDNLAAHAWLENEGRVLLGEVEGETYASLLCWKTGQG